MAFDCKIRGIKRMSLGFLLFFLLAAAVPAQQADLQPIAMVKLDKNEPITLAQLKTRVAAYEKELGTSMTPQQRQEVLDTLINERLVVQAAEKEGLRITDSDLNRSFNQVLSQQVGRQITEAEFSRMIKEQYNMTLDEFMRSQNGMSLAEYKRFLRSQMIAQQYVLMKRQNDLQNIQGPDDAAIRTYYDLNKQRFFQPDMARLFLVVAEKGNDPAAAEKLVSGIQRELKENPASAEAVRIRAQQAGSGFQAGEIYVNKNETAAMQLGITMQAIMEIFSMEKNTVSGVNETDSNFQCFLVQDKYPAKILEIGDVVQPGTTVTVYEFIRQNLMAQAQSEALSRALLSIINELKTPENYTVLKSGDALTQALSW